MRLTIHLHLLSSFGMSGVTPNFPTWFHLVLREIFEHIPVFFNICFPIIGNTQLAISYKTLVALVITLKL
jgi:hypothetical protein